MANYYFKTKVSSQPKAYSHCNYILGVDKYDYKQNEIAYVSSSLGMEEQRDFWYLADSHERANGRRYREFEMSLPSELPLEENIKIVDEFIAKHIGKRFHYTAVIHDKELNDNGHKNVHCHLMFNERELDGVVRPVNNFFKRYNPKNVEKGGVKKTTEFNSKDKLFELRKDFEIMINNAYAKNGLDISVSCETLAKQKEYAELANDYELAKSLDRQPVSIIKPYLLNKPFEKMNEIEQEYFLQYKLDKENKVEKINEYISYLETSKKLPVEKIEMTRELSGASLYFANEKRITELQNDLGNAYIDSINVKFNTLCKLNWSFLPTFREYKDTTKALDSIPVNAILSDETILLKEELLNKQTLAFKTLNDEADRRMKYPKFSNAISVEKSRVTANIDTISTSINNLENENDKILSNNENTNVSKLYSDNVRTVSKYLNSFLEHRHISNATNLTKKYLEEDFINRSVLNSLSKGKYKELEKEIKFYKNEISNLEKLCIAKPKQKDIFVNMINDYSNSLKDVELSFNEIKPELYPTYERTKATLKLNYEAKLLYLEGKEPLIKDNLCRHKSNLVFDSITKNICNELIESHKAQIPILEKQALSINNMKSNLAHSFNNDNLLLLAKNKLSKGKYLKIVHTHRNNYAQLRTYLDILKKEPDNTLAKLNKDKYVEICDSSLSIMQEANKEFATQSKELGLCMKEIIKSKEKAQAFISSLELNNTTSLNNLKTELYELNGMVKENYKAQDLKTLSINKKNLGKQPNIQGFGGGSSRILDNEDEILKDNKKQNTLSL